MNIKSWWYVVLMLPAVLSVPAIADPVPSLPRSDPERQGVSSKSILEFVDEADRTLDSLHSLMILRHGEVIAEGWWAPYDPATRHELYSLSKSFTSTAVGLAISEGRLSLDDAVMSFFPEQVPAEVPANLKSMRVRDLMCMSAGHQVEISTAADKMTVGAFLSHPVPFKPGTRFLYNTPATFMLSAIVQKATGMTVRDYLEPRLFAPLGIEGATWNSNIDGISLGGYGLNLRTEDIARFGQLYLQKGRWKDRQVIPGSWVETATSRQTSNGSNPASDWDQGYGFQFWRSRHEAYRGDGAFGQFCVVMPAEDAVVVTTAGLKDMQAVLNLVWKHLQPAMKPGRLPRNAVARDELKQRLSHLRLPTVDGGATPGNPAGWAGRKYVFPSNDQKLEALTLRDGGTEGMDLEFRISGKDQPVHCGLHAWHPGRISWGTFPDRAIAASGDWTAANRYEARICFRETPYILRLSMLFEGNRVTVEPAFNVSFGSQAPLPLTGESP